ncbi:MAG: ATPase [Candidatus Cryptobacteroides sp.]|nr:ATPase [Bacteroidales bacterium]MDD7134079.1 ATPase [Bacteroidales bacterium]MDY2773344.1 ATPase [Candidatus Cryptobacteroides sp.]
MEAPFIFGRIATDENFTDREKETEHLVNNFESLINTVIISPRRWGKSSLVHKAADIAMQADKNLKVCTIDLFNVKTEEQFYTALARNLIQETASRWEEAVENAKKFFSRLVPKISVGAGPGSEISIDFDWEEMKSNPDEILDLPERIAEAKGVKIVVCIDEFQNIAEFEDPLFFQRRLRAHWQRHRKVSYCLYGSKRHMMMDVFTDSSMPFYKFGDIFFLNKIDTEHFIPFIIERFSSTGKSITEDACRKIIALADNHPYYVQQLSQLSWLRTSGQCDVETVVKAHLSLVEQLSLLFSNLMETLTFQQTCYLHALIAGEKAITSAETMYRYHISSATAASRSLKTLIKKDILDSKSGEISFQDPIFEYWLRYNYYL